MQSAAEPLPLQVNSDTELPEETRLRYRFLDLRRERVALEHPAPESRHRVDPPADDRAGFTEFQTPILTSSSPEGARDYLVPSRVHPGKFYALPQAPQQFKQLLMVAGFDRYFQIAPCFRDEDGRADRSPGEFYQLDFEMSFVTQEDVFAAIEPVLHGVFEEFRRRARGDPAAVPAYPLRRGDGEVRDRQARSAQPARDRRRHRGVPGSGFAAFATAIEQGAVVRGCGRPGRAGQPRSFFDKLRAVGPRAGGARASATWSWPTAARGPDREVPRRGAARPARAATGAADGDAVFFVASKQAGRRQAGRSRRAQAGRRAGPVEKNAFRFCWIVDFPMYERERGDQARSSSATTRSRCRRAASRRWRRRTR